MQQTPYIGRHKAQLLNLELTQDPKDGKLIAILDVLYLQMYDKTADNNDGTFGAWCLMPDAQDGYGARIYTYLQKKELDPETKQHPRNESGIRQLQEALGWDGNDLTALSEIRTGELQVETKEEEYPQDSGKFSIRPNWIYKIDADIGIRPIEASKLAELQKGFGQQTASPATATKAPAKVKAQTAAPTPATKPVAVPAAVQSVQAKVAAKAAELGAAIGVAQGAAWDAACAAQGEASDDTLTAAWGEQVKLLNPRNVQQWENVGNVVAELMALLNNVSKPKPAKKAMPAPAAPVENAALAGNVDATPDDLPFN